VTARLLSITDPRIRGLVDAFAALSAGDSDSIIAAANVLEQLTALPGPYDRAAISVLRDFAGMQQPAQALLLDALDKLEARPGARNR
jgi:hypothetical protein